MLRALTLATLVTALPLFGAPLARAQTGQPTQAVLPPQYGVSQRPHIEIHPGRLLYRRCTDWYELQNRPSGPVLYPQMRCWWVRQ